MAEAYLNDQKRLLPCAAHVEGKYGVDGLYVGVPVIIGAGGVEQIVEIALDDQAKTNFQVSVDAVKELIAACKRSEEHTSELQSLMRISYAVFCLKKKKGTHNGTLVKLDSKTLDTLETHAIRSNRLMI